jgi:hypothetical protein
VANASQNLSLTVVTAAITTPTLLILSNPKVFLPSKANLTTVCAARQPPNRLGSPIKDKAACYGCRMSITAAFVSYFFVTDR